MPKITLEEDVHYRGVLYEAGERVVPQAVADLVFTQAHNKAQYEEQVVAAAERAEADAKAEAATPAPARRAAKPTKPSEAG